MKALKRIAAILTTISMAASMISVVNAAGTPNGTPITTEGDSEQRGDIIYTILGTSSASSDGWYEPEGEEGYDTSYGDGSREGEEDLDSLIPADADEYIWEDGGLVWIAIQTENIDRIQAMLNAKPAEGLTISNSNSGVYTWSLALAFDSNYFEFPASAGNYSNNQSDAFLSDNYPIGKSNRPMYSFKMEPEDPTLTACTTYQQLLDAPGAASMKPLSLTASANKINVCKVGISATNIGTTAAQSKALWQGTTISAAKQTMFVIPLKMKGTTPAPIKALEAYFDGSVNTLTVGSSSTYAVSYNYDVRRDNKEKTNLNNYFNIKDYLLNAKFKSNAEQTGITVETTDATKHLTYKDMQDVHDITAVKKVMDDASNPEITDYELWYSAATDADVNDCVSKSYTDITADGSGWVKIDTTTADTTTEWKKGVPKAADGKNLYVVDPTGGYVYNLGTLTVTATDITSITNVSGAGPGTVYNGDTVTIPTNAKVTCGYDNGKSKTLSKADAETAGVKFYLVTDNSGTETLTEVKTGTDAPTYPAAGKQKMTIKYGESVRLSASSKDYYEVDVTYNKVAILADTSSKLTLKYNANETMDTTGIAVKYATLKVTSGQTKKNTGTTFADLGLKVVIAPANETNANLYAKAGVSTGVTITQTMIDDGYHVYVVANNDSAANISKVDLGAISAKAGNSYAVDGTLALAGTTAAEKTYPNAKLNLASATVKVTNTDDSSQNKTINLTDTGVTLSIVESDADSADVLASSVDADTVIKPAWAGKKLKIVVTNGSETKTLYTNIPAATKKTITIAFTGTVADRDYAWDASNVVDTSVPSTAITAAWTTGDIVSGDETEVATLPTITYSYDDGSAADGKDVLATWAAKDYDNYTVAAGSAVDTTLDGNIKPKEVTAKWIVTVSQDPTQSGDLTLTDAPTTLVNTTTDPSPFRTGDTVTATVNGSIAEGDVKVKGDNVTVNTPTFTYGGDNANYTITSSVTATVTDLPVATELQTASMTDIDNKVAEYANVKASNTTLNTEDNLIDALAGLPTTGKVTGMKDGSAAGEFDVDITWTVDKTFDEKGTTYTYTAHVTPKDATKVVVSITDFTKEITIAPVPVTKPEVTVDASVTVGGTVTLPDKTTVTVDGTSYNVPITWTVEGDTTEITEVPTGAVGDVTVTGTYDYSNIPSWATLPKDSSDNEDNTITKTITVTAEAIPKAVSLDTNDGDTIKALNIFKNGLTFKATDPANADLDALMAELPQTLTVLDENNVPKTVNIKWTTTNTHTEKEGEYTFTPELEVPDGVKLDLTGFAPAEITDVKVKVEKVVAKPDASVFNPQTIYVGGTFAFTGNGSVVVDGITVPYTITWSPAADTIDTTTAATTSVTITVTPDPAVIAAHRELTIDSADWTKTVDMTVKKKSSGGGGSSGLTVKFQAGDHGTLDKNKTTVNVTVTTNAKVAATKVPTVVAADGYKFIGWAVKDTTQVVDPTAEAVKKSVTYVALYEEAVVPTPTPTPTPLITNNLKPYASGYDDGMFLPDDYITRAELASMIARLIEGDDIPNSYRASFPDVDNTWYNKYIGYLEDKDVLSGYEDGTFRPNQTVTRGEMCAIIARAQRYALIPIDGLFSDVTDEDWAKDYITTLAGKGIVSGYENGTFGTYSPITRAETVVIINRVLEPSEPIITFTPIDISTHWAKADIILAVNERRLISDVATPEVTPEATPEVAPEETAEPEATPAA